MKKRFLILTAILVFIILSSSIYFINAAKQDCIATMAGDEISKTEYLLMFKVQCEKLLSENDIYTDDMKKQFWSRKIDGKLPEEIIRERTLDKLKEMKIQLQKAEEYGIMLDKNDQKSAGEYVVNIKKEVSGSSDNEEVEKEFIKQYGVTSEQYEPLYEKILLIRKMISKESENTQIAEEEMKAYYNKFKENVDNFTIRDILFATVDLETNEALTDEKQQEAGKKAISVLNRLQAGEDAEKLAVDNSEDPNVDNNKGQYSFKVQGDQPNEIEQWVLKAKAGDTGIVNTFYGYHVVRLEKRSDYSEVKQDIREILFEGKYMDLLDTWKSDPKYDITLKTVNLSELTDIAEY